jgi:hypothetical protein
LTCELDSSFSVCFDRANVFWPCKHTRGCFGMHRPMPAQQLMFYNAPVLQYLISTWSVFFGDLSLLLWIFVCHTEPKSCRASLALPKVKKIKSVCANQLFHFLFNNFAEYTSENSGWPKRESVSRFNTLWPLCWPTHRFLLLLAPEIRTHTVLSIGSGTRQSVEFRSNGRNGHNQVRFFWRSKRQKMIFTWQDRGVMVLNWSFTGTQEVRKSHIFSWCGCCYLICMKRVIAAVAVMTVVTVSSDSGDS